MPRFKVVVTDFVGQSLESERKILGDLADVEALLAASEDDLAGRIEDADAIMIYHLISITRPTIDQLKHCRLIVRCGVGFDNVDIRAARERRIPVANVPDYGTEEVADSAVGHALALMRGIHFLNSRLRRGYGEWTYEQVKPVHRLRSRTCGVIGVGRIGTAAALRFKALGMNVLYFDPHAPDGRDKALGIRRVEEVSDLMAQSDVVTLHCPLTEETREIINDDTLARLRPGSFLVNTARGGVVNAQAVLRGIESGRLAGAALDVLATEPPDHDDPLIAAWRNPDHPAHDRLILNPHAAFYSEEGLEDMRTKGSENCRRVLHDQPPRNVVN